jgi:hypothetical protein
MSKTTSAAFTSVMPSAITNTTNTNTENRNTGTGY